MNTIVVIPARMHSSRLPGKILLDLGGRSVLQRVYEQCLKAGTVDKVFIAVDHPQTMAHCQTFTDAVVMTDPEHPSGTDRIAEVAEALECDTVINVQGDEPFIDPQLIDDLALAMQGDDVMASAMHRISQVEELKSSSVVKVTVDRHAHALYFSRSIIPHHRDAWESLLNHHETIPEPLAFYRHLGIYAYRRAFLLQYAAMEPTYLERLEKLEQLRVLENGFKIRMVETAYPSLGIDTPEDYEHAKRKLIQEDRDVV